MIQQKMIRALLREALGGGGDDDTQDWSLPGGSTDSPEEQKRSWWQKGARPKTKGLYEQLPHDDEDTPMSRFPKEKSGLPSTPKKTEETSFIVGTPSGKIRTADQMATSEVEKDFPYMDHNRVEVRYNKTGRGTEAIIEIKMRNKTKWYPLLTKTRGDDEKTSNEKLPKEVQSALDPLIGVQIKDAEIQQKDAEIEEIKKTKQEHQRVADDENEQPSVRSHAREKVAEDTERENQAVREREQLEQEREQIEERLPLRERLKNLFKKHGFAIATVVTAVGITIATS